MQGVHNYDILANPLYLDDFQYVSPVYGDARADYIIDNDDDEENDDAQSDIVKVALNLAFLTEEFAMNFSFDKKAFVANRKQRFTLLNQKRPAINY